MLINRNIFDNAVFVYKHKQFDRAVLCAAAHRVVAISDNFIAVFRHKARFHVIVFVVVVGRKFFVLDGRFRAESRRAFVCYNSVGIDVSHPVDDSEQKSCDKRNDGEHQRAFCNVAELEFLFVLFLLGILLRYVRFYVRCIRLHVGYDLARFLLLRCSDVFLGGFHFCFLV